MDNGSDTMMFEGMILDDLRFMNLTRNDAKDRGTNWKNIRKEVAVFGLQDGLLANACCYACRLPVIKIVTTTHILEQTVFH